MRVVLAEDSVLMREGVAALLERAGHQVTDAVDDADALRRTLLPRTDAELPDLVLTDVRMPPGNADDGLRAALSIRQTHPRLPIVLLSQWVGNEHLDRLLASVRARPDAGGVGYLLKDRVSHVRGFLASLDAVAAGGVVVDREVVGTLIDDRQRALGTLTDRERDVLRLLSGGDTNQQIAAALHLSEGAVVKHVSVIFGKLGVTAQDGNRRVLAVLTYLRGQPG